MIVDDDQLITINCWRCGEPMIGLLWSEPGIMLQCSCSGWTRLPEIKLDDKGDELVEAGWLQETISKDSKKRIVYLINPKIYS